MRILVVDDASSIRFLVRLLLEEAGMEVEEAASGTAALARLERRCAPVVDAVVIDQRMPDMSGLEVAAELVARGPHPPLFLFTSYLMPELEAEAHRLAVTPVLKSDLDGLVVTLAAARGVAA